MSIRASTKKRGRPKTTGKGQQIGVRILPPDLVRLDAWIGAQPEPRPTRPEAIRRLVDSALASAEPGPAGDDGAALTTDEFVARYAPLLVQAVAAFGRISAGSARDDAAFRNAAARLSRDPALPKLFGQWIEDRVRS